MDIDMKGVNILHVIYWVANKEVNGFFKLEKEVPVKRGQDVAIRPMPDGRLKLGKVHEIKDGDGQPGVEELEWVVNVIDETRYKTNVARDRSFQAFVSDDVVANDDNLAEDMSKSSSDFARAVEKHLPTDEDKE